MAVDPKRKKEIEEITGVIQESLFSIAENFSNAVNDALDAGGGAAAASIKDVTNNINKMARFTSDLVKNRAKLFTGTMNLQKLEEQRRLKMIEMNFIQTRAQQIIDNLVNSGKKLTKEQEQQLANAKQDIAYLEVIKRETNELYEADKKRLEAAEKISGENKSMFDDLLKKVPVYQQLFSTPFKKAQEEVRKLAVESEKTGKKLENELNEKFKDIYSKEQAKQRGKIAQELFPIAFATLFAKALLDVDKKLAQLGNQFAVSTGQAIKFKKEFNDMAHESTLLTKELIEANTQLSEFFGTNIIFQQGLVQGVGELTKLMKISAEDATQLALVTGATADNFKDFNESLAESVVEHGKLNGVNMTFKQAAEAVAGMSTETLFNLRRNPEAIGRAVTQSQRLGLSFEILENTASKLLDFESSISAELEAELITGKQLNLQRARAAALTGDTEVLMQEIAKNVGTLSEYEQMAPMQREAMAKAIGMTAEEMGNMLLRQEAMTANAELGAKFNAEQLKQAKKVADTQDISLGEALIKQQQQLTAQESLNRLLGVFQNAMGNLATQLMPIVTYLTDTFETMSKSPMVAKILSIVTAAGGFGAIVMGLSKLILGSSPFTPLFVKDVSMGGPGGSGGGFVDSQGRYRNSKGQFAKRPKGNRFMRGAKGLGRLGGGLALLGGGLDLYNNFQDKELSSGDAILKTLDQNKFAVGGAILGSIFPGVGTLLGAGIGGLIDMAVGPSVYDDFIVRPGQKPMRINKGDIVMGGTQLDGGAGMNERLDRLISVVEKGAVVKMNSNAVGSALVMAGIKNR